MPTSVCHQCHLSAQCWHLARPLVLNNRTSNDKLGDCLVVLGVAAFCLYQQG